MGRNRLYSVLHSNVVLNRPQRNIYASGQTVLGLIYGLFSIGVLYHVLHPSSHLVSSTSHSHNISLSPLHPPWPPTSNLQPSIPPNTDQHQPKPSHIIEIFCIVLSLLTIPSQYVYLAVWCLQVIISGIFHGFSILYPLSYWWEVGSKLRCYVVETQNAGCRIPW